MGLFLLNLLRGSLIKQNSTAITITVFALFLSSCSRGVGAPEKKDVLAYVGIVPITQIDADAFDFVTRYMPVAADSLSLVRNGRVWALIATEAICQEAGRTHADVMAGQDREWKWEKWAYLSKAFELQVLQGNCGSSDAEVRRYYDTHLRDFRVVVFPDTAKPCTTQVVPPFDSIRGEVAKRLFLDTYDRELIKQDLHDPRLFNMFRERLYRDYFLKKYYREKYGEPLSDSLYPRNGLIDSGDIAIVLSWMPAAERDSYKKDPVFIVRRLLQWKLFCEKAESMRYAANPDVRKVLAWAWKYEIARRFVLEVLSPIVRRNVRIDSAMALYSCWDENGSPSATIDSVKLKNRINRLSEEKKNFLIDSLIYRIRCASRVKFVNSDAWSDGRVKDPALLMQEADLSRDSGNVGQAQTLYNILTDYFIFTAEGKNALFELAKIQAESQDPAEAIKNFRRFLLHDSDPGKRCEAMYRIGFLYGQQLNKRDMAEAHYRWLLKNAPECAFTRDAEVMLRHLGGPLPSVEELRAEARRQGKP